jgi:hypothetical protein
MYRVVATTGWGTLSTYGTPTSNRFDYFSVKVGNHDVIAVNWIGILEDESGWHCLSKLQWSLIFRANPLPLKLQYKAHALLPEARQAGSERQTPNGDG